MSCFVQYAPPKVNGRDWTDADRDGFAESVISQIAEYSPGFRDRIVHMEVRTPRELEAEVGLTEGNIFQGELTFDQLLFNRPVPGYAQYRSPVGGLYNSRGLHRKGAGNFIATRSVGLPKQGDRSCPLSRPSSPPCRPPSSLPRRFRASRRARLPNLIRRCRTSTCPYRSRPRRQCPRPASRLPDREREDERQ